MNQRKMYNLLYKIYLSITNIVNKGKDDLSLY